jgi:hypothetical protein
MVLLTLYDGCNMLKSPIILVRDLISACNPIKKLLMKFKYHIKKLHMTEDLIIAHIRLYKLINVLMYIFILPQKYWLL